MAALEYVRRGWAVVPLHDVTGGACSCGSADPKHDASQGGKHPIGKGWQNAGLMSAAAVQDAWARRPGANIGIVTGRASGIWVLDVDPEHGGDEKLRALVAAYGALPETYTVETGSGGRHYYWLMPDFDFTTSRGQLPVGLDVRGNAGQVVAPPSHTLKGPYKVLVPAPIVEAPGWLLAMIRPVEPSPERMADLAAYVAPEQLSGADRDRCHAYAQVAVRDNLIRLATSPPGTRNDIAYRVGIRLAELVNSPWAGLDPEMIWQSYMAAAAHADTDGGFSQDEAYRTLAKAVRARGGRPIPPPPPPTFMGDRVNWTESEPTPSDFDQAAQDAASPFISPGQIGTSTPVAAPLINGPSEQLIVEDPFENAVLTELGRLLVREEAARRLKVREQVRTDFDQVALDDAGMFALPDAVMLIDRWLETNTLTRINGPSGHGKSFVVLDVGACVSTGRPWHGAAVTPTRVCYVVAEGARGMAKRARAWCQRHGVDSTGITFVPRPVQIEGAEWRQFVDWCARRDFGLVIFDTQARNTLGVDENDATEMGAIVAALDQLKVATEACVVLVHHRGLRGSEGRGSSAVKGAIDIEWDISRNGTTITVKSNKQKDRADPEDLRLTMNPLGPSVVLVAEGDVDSSAGPFVSPVSSMSLREKCAVAIAHALIDASGSGLTRTEAQSHARVALGLGADESVRRVVRRAWSDLVGLGRIAKASGREAHFFLELDGAPILSANPGKMVEGGPETYVP